jgi:hypothetical protein
LNSSACFPSNEAMILSSCASQSVGSAMLSLFGMVPPGYRVAPRRSLMFSRTRVFCAPEQNTSSVLRVHRTQYTTPLAHLNPTSHTRPSTLVTSLRRRSATRRSSNEP